MVDLSTNNIKLGKWNFHELKLEDIHIYSEFIKATEYPANLWSSNFAYLWVSSQSRLRKLLWKVIDDMLVTFANSFKNSLYLFCLPFGKGNPEKLIQVLSKCMKYCYDWNNQDNTRTMVRMINHNQLEFLRNSSEFDNLYKLNTLQGIERHLDVNKLVSLSGYNHQTR